MISGYEKYNITVFHRKKEHYEFVKKKRCSSIKIIIIRRNVYLERLLHPL